jgi:hypothetical protein
MNIENKIKNELNNTRNYTDEYKMDYARIYAKSYVKSNRNFSEIEMQENNHSKIFFSNYFPIIPTYHERSRRSTHRTTLKTPKTQKIIKLKKLDFIKDLNYEEPEMLNNIKSLIEYILKNGLMYINFVEPNYDLGYELNSRQSSYNFILEMRYLKYKYLYMNKLNKDVATLTVEDLMNSNIGARTLYDDEEDTFNYFTFTDNNNFDKTENYKERRVEYSPVLINDTDKTIQQDMATNYYIPTLKTHILNLNLISLFDSLYYECECDDNNQKLYFINYKFYKKDYDREIKPFLNSLFNKLCETNLMDVKFEFE